MAKAAAEYDEVADGCSDSSSSSSSSDEYDEVRKGVSNMLTLEKKLESLL